MEKELISIHYQHGIVFDTKTIQFNPNICEEMLTNNLDDNSKRELIQALFIYNYNLLCNNESDSNKSLGYGITRINLGRNIQNISIYEKEIINKIYNEISNVDIEKSVAIMEDILQIKDKKIINNQDYQNIKETIQKLSKEYVQNITLQEELISNLSKNKPKKI